MQGMVTLIGYRGCGKSTVAPLLADRLQRSWVDTDRLIEQSAHCSIREIFANEGEQGFRDRETRVIREVCDGAPQVVAVGGGAILREDNRQMLQRAGVVIWLRAEPEVLIGRMEADASGQDNRPRLAGNDVRGEVLQVLNVRQPIYQAAADFIVDVDQLTPQQAADTVAEQLAVLSEERADR